MDCGLGSTGVVSRSRRSPPPRVGGDGKFPAGLKHHSETMPPWVTRTLSTCDDVAALEIRVRQAPPTTTGAMRNAPASIAFAADTRTPSPQVPCLSILTSASAQGGSCWCNMTKWARIRVLFFVSIADSAAQDVFMNADHPKTSRRCVEATVSCLVVGRPSPSYSMIFGCAWCFGCAAVCSDVGPNVNSGIWARGSKRTKRL